MTTERPELLDILGIAHDQPLGGAGLSLREALRRARYVDRRLTFEAADLRPLLAADPELCEAWFACSEDKRTNGGWYLLRTDEIGQVDDPRARHHFDSPENAVAEYVVRELDFWAALGRTG